MTTQQGVATSAVISILVENESGALARVLGLFSGRGYNIESLTVAPVDEAGRLSRINIVTTGTPHAVAQVRAQLERLVPVWRVANLSEGGPHVARELALVKVVATAEARAESCASPRRSVRVSSIRPPRPLSSS